MKNNIWKRLKKLFGDEIKKIECGDIFPIMMGILIGIFVGLIPKAYCFICHCLSLCNGFNDNLGKDNGAFLMLQNLYLIIIVVTLIGVAIGRFPNLKMNRATISLAGATILLGLGAITTDIAFKLIDLNTIAFIFSMMILNTNLKISDFFSLISGYILKYGSTPKKFLSLIIISGALSAIFLNDTIVLILTPLIIYSLKSLKVNPIPYIMAIPISSNIGLMSTINGNPQNMVIGISSKIPYSKFLFHLTFPAKAVFFNLFCNSPMFQLSYCSNLLYL